MEHLIPILDFPHYFENKNFTTPTIKLGQIGLSFVSIIMIYVIFIFTYIIYIISYINACMMYAHTPLEMLKSYSMSRPEMENEICCLVLLDNKQIPLPAMLQEKFFFSNQHHYSEVVI